MERLLYLAAAVAYLVPLSGVVWKGAPAALRHGLWWALALVLHVGGLLVAAVSLGQLPLESMRWGLAVLSLAVVGAALLTRGRPRMEVVGQIQLCLGMALLVLAQLGPGSEARGPLENLWLPVHLGLLFVGFALLAASFAMSALFLWLRQRLKQRRLRGIARFPPLEVIDRRNFHTMVGGFVALTAGMSVGGMWAATHPGASIGEDLTVYTTLAVWGWYAAGLYTRLVAGWRGRVAAVFGVVGFGGLAVVIALALAISRGWHGGAA